MVNKATRNIIGKKLKELREGSGITQDLLAEKLEYSVDTISRIETGKASMSEKFRTKASEFFKVNETYFFSQNSSTPEKEQIIEQINSQLIELDIHKLKAMEHIIRTVKSTWL